MATKYLTLGFPTSQITFNGTGTAIQSIKWKMPYVSQQTSPFMTVSVQSCYVDDSAGVKVALPHILRLKNILPTNAILPNGETGNNSVGDKNSVIMALLNRDVIPGHWFINGNDSTPKYTLPTNLQYLEFDFVDGDGLAIEITENVNIIMKIEYPQTNEIMNQVVGTFAKTIM